MLVHISAHDHLDSAQPLARGERTRNHKSSRPHSHHPSNCTQSPRKHIHTQTTAYTEPKISGCVRVCVCGIMETISQDKQTHAIYRHKNHPFLVNKYVYIHHPPLYYALCWPSASTQTRRRQLFHPRWADQIASPKFVVASKCYHPRRPTWILRRNNAYTRFYIFIHIFFTRTSATYPIDAHTHTYTQTSKFGFT